MIFEVVGSEEQLRQQLQRYKDRLVRHERRSLALIINLGRSHWVTLVVTCHNQRFLSSYYIDSLGNDAPSWVKRVMMEEVINIYSFRARQQEDSFNCGIFALENLRIMNESIQSGNIEQMFQVVNYRPSREKLQEIREDFMIILRYYLGYGQSREGDSESIIDRCEKAIEYAEREDMNGGKKGQILNGLRELLNIPIPPDRANLLDKLGLYHNHGIDRFSDEEKEALRGLFGDIDLYKKLSTRGDSDEWLRNDWLRNENARYLYESLLRFVKDNQGYDTMNQNIEEASRHSGADAASLDSEKGVPFLVRAIIEGRADYAIALINYYLYKGIDISAAVADENWTLLHFATHGGRSSITRSFFIEILNPIERFINEELTPDERNILVELINSEHEIVREINYSMDRIAKELIAKGADPNKPTLGSAVSYGKLSLHGPLSEEVNQGYIGPFNPETPFTFVILYKRIPVVLAMIDKVGLERLDFNREYTPLHYIAKSMGISDEEKTNEERQQERDLAEILARTMGDISKKDYEGNTPLHEAVINGNRYIVELFLKRDYLFPQMGILSIRNLEGRTAIHEAAARNEHEILELLVRVATQSDLDIQDEDGRTAIKLVEEKAREAAQGLRISPKYERTLSILKQSAYQSWKIGELDSKSSFPNLPDVTQDYGNIHAHLDEARRSYQEGLFLNERGEYLSAIIPLERSVENYKADRLNSPDEKVELGNAYWLLGLAYMRSSQLEQAILNTEISIEWYKSAERYDLLEHPYQQLARILLDFGDIGKGYMNGHIQTIEDNNARSINKLCSHLALAGIYSVITERQLESSLGLNPEHVKWKQSFHYSEAYKLTQGNLDNSAHVVLQREMGIAYNENIGTYNIQQCVAVVAHDTKTDKVVLSHFDRYSGPLKFIKQILEQFPSQNKIDIHVYGGRDRAALDESGRYLVSDNNINQVLKQIYRNLARVNVISINVARSLPPGVVYIVKDRKLVHATPNHPDKSISSRAATISLSLWPKKTGGYLYPIRGVDFSKSEEKRIVLFNDEQKRRLQEIGEQQKQRLNSEGSARSLMWSSNQILHPIDDTLQQGLSSMEVQQTVLSNIDGVARNSNIRPISDHQLILAQTNRQNPGIEDFIDYYMKELQPSNLDDIEIDALLDDIEIDAPLDDIKIDAPLDDIEMLDLDGCSGSVSKKKRSIQGSCIDSRDEESAEEQGKKKALIRELFDSNEIREEMGVAELHDVLLKASEQISEGGTLSQDIEKVLVARTKDVNLDLIDPEIRNIIEEIKRSINDGKIDKKRTKDILSKPKISNMLVNAAGRISLIRSIHGTLYALSQGDMLEFGLGAGEIAFSPLSDLIEDSIVKHLSKEIGQIKGGVYIARGVGGLTGNVFDIVDLVHSSIDLSKAKEGSKEWRDAIAGVTFSSVSVLSGVVFAVFSMPIAGTMLGFTMLIGQGSYSGASILAELREYRLTADEEFRTFWHTFALQPLPEDVEYIVFRKQVLDSLIHQKSEALGNGSNSVLAYMTGLGHTSVEGDNSRPDYDCSIGGVIMGCPPSNPNRPAPIPRGPYTKAAHAVVNMAELHYADKFSRFADFNPIGSDSNYYRICLPECPSEEEKYGYDCTLGSGASGGTVIDPKGMFHCENAVVIAHAGRARNAVRKNTDGRVFFDLNLVSSGKIYGSSKWENEFVIREGTIEVYGGNGTVNIFTLVDSGFRGRIFGGNNATNIINVSHLERDIQYDSENGVLFNIIMKKINYLIGSKKKSETVNCSQDDMVVDSGGAEHGLDYINDCRQAAIYGNTQVRSKRDGDHKFYVIPSIGHSSIDIEGKGVIIFPETALLNDCHNITYTVNGSLSLEILLNTNEEKFTLDILNYLDKQNAGRFTLVDKHDSTIVPLIDLDGKGGKAVKVDSFALSADITLNKEKIEGIMEKTLEEIWEEKRTILKEEQKLYNDTAKSEHSQIVLGENAVKELDWSRLRKAREEILNSEECSAQDKNAVRETFDYTEAGFRKAKREKDQALKKLVNACKKRSDAIETKWKKKRQDLWSKETEEAEKAWEEVVEEKEKALEIVKGEVRELQEKFTRELDKYCDMRAAGINGVSETKGGCLGVASSVGQSSKEKLEVWCNAYKEKNRLSDMLKILGCAKKEAEYEEFKARKEANDDGIEEIVEEGVEESDVKSGRSELALVAVQKVLDAKIEVEKTKQTGKGKFEARLRLREELAKARKAIMKEETASKFEASLNEAGITGEEVSKKVDELQKLEENEEKNKKLRYISTIKDKKQLYVAYYAMVKDRSALLNWHEKIAKSYDGYKVCSTIKESSFNTEVSNESILGSTVSDVIFLEGSGFASGGEGGDLYIFSARNIKQDPNYFIEVDNGAKDKELDILEMPIIPEATVYGCHLLLGQLNNTYIKIRDYFLSDEYRHLVLMNGKRERFFLPSAQGKRSCDKIVEGTWEAPDIQSVQFISFYHATSKRNFYNVTEDQMRSHQMIAIGAHLNNTSFYRVHDNLVLMETNKDKNLTVNLPGFFQKGSTDLYFYPDNCQLNLTEVDQLVTAIPMSNTNFFRYYQVSKEGLEIYHNQPTNKHQVGLIDLKSRSILGCSVEIIGGDLILSFEGNAIATVKNWNIHQPARKMMFAFNDTAVFNARCISSNCDPEGIVEEFRKEIKKLINRKNKYGDTQLHYAAREGNLNLVTFLLDSGADINIVNFLRGKQSEEPLKRKRCHHHGDHDHHHSSCKPLAIDLSNQPEVAASSANQKSSWINVFTNTIVDAVKGVSRFISSPFKPTIDMEHSKPSKAATIQGTDANGTLLLLDIFIRKITGQKYISNNIRSISEQEVQIYVLSIAEEFEQALESAAIESGISVTNLKFNPVEVSLKVAGQIRSGKFSEISKTLYSSAKEACPEFEQTGEFLVHVKSHLEEFLAKKETVFLQQKQTADQPISSVSRKVVAMEPSKKPDTFLSDTSVAKGIKHVLGL